MSEKTTEEKTRKSSGRLVKFSDFKVMVEEVDKVDEQIRRSLNAVDKYHHAKEKEGSYPYIPFYDEGALHDLFTFLKNLQGPLGWDSIKMLDVGCGTGRIVKLAQMVGIQAKGVEFHEPYVTLGREIFELSAKDLMVGDAFDLSKEFVEQFNVIYTYMPLHNAIKMSELHLSLYNKSRNGTYFVEMLPSYYPVYMYRAYAGRGENHRFAYIRSQTYYSSM